MENMEMVLGGVWYVAWRSFIIYSCYVCRGKVGVTKAVFWALVWVTMFGASGTLGDFGSDKFDVLSWYFNGLVVTSFCVIGKLCSGRNLLIFLFGYSTTREGSLINRILKGDK